VPSVVFPNVSLAQGFPNTYARCTSTTTSCARSRIRPAPACGPLASPTTTPAPTTSRKKPRPVRPAALRLG
jgi:hypothetical protein